MQEAIRRGDLDSTQVAPRGWLGLPLVYPDVWEHYATPSRKETVALCGSSLALRLWFRWSSWGLIVQIYPPSLNKHSRCEKSTYSSAFEQVSRKFFHMISRPETPPLNDCLGIPQPVDPYRGLLGILWIYIGCAWLTASNLRMRSRLSLQILKWSARRVAYLLHVIKMSGPFYTYKSFTWIVTHLYDSVTTPLRLLQQLQSSDFQSASGSSLLQNAKTTVSYDVRYQGSTSSYSYSRWMGCMVVLHSGSYHRRRECTQGWANYCVSGLPLVVEPAVLSLSRKHGHALTALGL